MSFKIESVDAGSPAARAGIKAGEHLVSVNGNAIGDVLDYRYYTADPELSVVLANDGGEERTVHIRNRNYLPLGLNFSTYLMDEKRSCSNHCVFCFIDQLPPGLRESL
ncbi:MAG: PDZ domain-containing protein, partial [Eubacteriales bacterium]